VEAVKRFLRRGDERITVKGTDDLLVFRAKCCNPIMGEPIVGYITRGKGVSVHSVSCPNVTNLVYDPEQYSTVAAPAGAVALSEGSRLATRNLCGAAKLYSEAELRFVNEVQAAGFRASFARIFRVYGRGSRDVVSRWVRAALDGEPFDVYHPENRFDYVFSGDVADGLLRMATSERASGVINLGSGKARPVAAVIEAVERATGTRLDPRTKLADEPYEASCADVARLQATLGWTPPTSLEAGVERLVEFERAKRREGASVGVDR
jgi:nucleoside-diphosphate-sugar epimerase